MKVNIANISVNQSQFSNGMSETSKQVVLIA
jgi:hypothetical protein